MTAAGWRWRLLLDLGARERVELVGAIAAGRDAPQRALAEMTDEVGPAKAQKRLARAIDGGEVVEAGRAMVAESRQLEVAGAVDQQVREIGVEMPHLRVDLADEGDVAEVEPIDRCGKRRPDLGVGVENQRPLGLAEGPKQDVQRRAVMHVD